MTRGARPLELFPRQTLPPSLLGPPRPPNPANAEDDRPAEMLPVTKTCSLMGVRDYNHFRTIYTTLSAKFSAGYRRGASPPSPPDT